MKDKLIGKAVIVLILGLFLVIASLMVMGLVSEREHYKEKAIQAIAASVSGEQNILGPILVIPYKLSVRTHDSRTDTTTRSIQEYSYYVLPQELSVVGDANVVPRKLGIYQTQLYSGEFKLKGSFGSINFDELRDKSGFVSMGEPYFVVAVKDTRGILDVPSFTLNRNALELKEGVLNSDLGKGVHIPVGVDALRVSEKNEFDFSIKLQGTQSLSVVPVGRTSDFAFKSNWPHPNFLGSTLPQTHDISAEGFTANWQSSWFATNINDMFARDSMSSYYIESLPAFSVSLVETVDEYQLNERSVKYAVLFIGLTFIAFLAFELLAQLKIHPVQYTLVGASLIMFYLLLLALSEHLGFALAYGLAALVSCGLIGVYLCSVLKGVKRGGMFAASLLVLYGLLFLILHSEDMALLLGSILLFAVLGVVMLLTRKVDWYQVASAEKVMGQGNRMRKTQSHKNPSQTVGTVTEAMNNVSNFDHQERKNEDKVEDDKN